MATIIAKSSLNGFEVLKIDTDPIISGGLAAPIGAFASAIDGTGLFYKSGATDTDWDNVGFGNNTLNNVVIVNQLSDLPAASGGKRVLAANTKYLITGSINIGTDYLELSGATAIEGITSFIANIIYSGAGAAIRGVDFNVTIRLVTIISPIAFDFTNVGRDKYCVIQQSVITTQTSPSVITGFKTTLFNIVNWIGNVGCITLTDNGFVVMQSQSFPNSNSGTYITINPQTYSSYNISQNDFQIDGIAIGINVTSTNIQNGLINGNVFQGTSVVANRLTGVNGNTANWNITYGMNVGISGLQIVDVDMVSTSDVTISNAGGTYIEPTTVRGYVLDISNYDALATTMECRNIALMSNPIGSQLQLGVRQLSTPSTNLANLSPPTEGIDVQVTSAWIAITGNKNYNAYYVKNNGICTRFALKMQLKIY